MTIPAYAISANALTAETFRQAPSSLLAAAGVVNPGDLAVTQNGSPNMSVNVAAGQGWAPGTLASTTGFGTNQSAQTGYGLSSAFNEQGSYYGWVNGTVNLTISTPDPTNPRIDLICFSAQDAEYSGSNNQLVLQVITGTPAASPSAPAAPASTTVLAQVAVAAGATSIVTGNITDERPFAATIAAYPTLGRATATSVTVASSSATHLAVTETALEGNITFASNQFTVTNAGLYSVTVTASSGCLSETSPYRFGPLILHNGSQVGAGFLAAIPALFSPQAVSPSGTDIIACSAGDTLGLGAYQNSGASFTSSVSGVITVRQVG